jgi:hypothetical protein
MLKDPGFITTRDLASTNWIGRLITAVMCWFAMHVFGIITYQQTLAELEKAYFDQGFFTVVRTTWFPAFRQFTTIKK